MPAPWVILSLLFAVCFSCATALDTWRQTWAGNRSQSANVLNVLMGDSRRMFANHFFVKADIYFHGGYYPSIFDSVKKKERLHIQESGDHAEHEGEAEEDEGEFLQEPRDWIERLGRNFFPTQHAHLEQGEQRELLPWLKIAAELDPQKIQTYTVGAYWLRTQLNQPEEAERLLRDGWRVNPDSYEILFELGRLRKQHHKDPAGAKNLWLVALQNYRKQAAAGIQTDEFVLEEILASLGELAEEEGNYKEAISYFSRVKELSPSKAELEKRIAALQAKVQKE